MRPVRSIATVLLIAGVAVAGCGRSQPNRPAVTTPPSGGPGASASTASPGPASSNSAGSEPAVLADGRHPVYLKTVDTSRRTITFDLIQWFTGEDAVREAAKDHKESPPPNDYYIRNVNPKLRTLPVGPSATITVNTLAAEQTGSSTKDVPVTMAELAKLLPAFSPPFWITVQNGQVVAIAEQFIP